MGELKTRDTILFIIGEGSSRRGFGRTSLQKVAYFAGLLLNRDFGHRPHYYGPFSPLVEREVEALVMSGLGKETSYSLGFAGPGGFEAKQYEYDLTEEGRERIRALWDAHRTELQALKGMISRFDEIAGGLEPSILSPAAKTLFIAQEEHRALESSEIGELAGELGWDLSHEQVQKVGGLLEQMGLLKEIG